MVAKREVQFLKLGRNLEAGSRSKLKASSQIAKNNQVLESLAADAKK